MANRDDRFFGSGSSSPGRRPPRTGPPISLEADDVGIGLPLSHHSHAGNSSPGTVPQLPRDHMHRELILGGVVPRNVSSSAQPPDDIGDIGQRFGSFCLVDRIQQPSDSIGESSGVPGVFGSVQHDDIDDTMHQLRCTICYVRWLNLVVKTCRHSICDVCYSKGTSTCVICRNKVTGNFPLRFHSAYMIEDIDIPTVSQDQRGQIQTLVDMGFQRADIRRAIRHTYEGLNTSLNLNVIAGILLSMDGSEGANSLIESTYSIPTPEELEHILKDPKANPEDKSKLVEWLQVTAKCLVCKDKSPCICLMPCYHLAICLECYEDTKTRPQLCPDSHCGKKIANQVKIHI